MRYCPNLGEVVKVNITSAVSSKSIFGFILSACMFFLAIASTSCVDFKNNLFDGNTPTETQSVTYTIKYDLGSNPCGLKATDYPDTTLSGSILRSDNLTEIQTSNKDEFRFDGWYYQNYLIPPFGINVPGDITVEAKWTQGYKITYNDSLGNDITGDVDSANPNKDIYLYYWDGDTFDSSKVPDMPKLPKDCTFGGWEHNGSTFQSLPASGPITLKADIEENELPNFSYKYPKVMYTKGAATSEVNSPSWKAGIPEPLADLEFSALAPLPSGMYIDSDSGSITINENLLSPTASDFTATVKVQRKGPIYSDAKAKICTIIIAVRPPFPVTVNPSWTELTRTDVIPDDPNNDPNNGGYYYLPPAPTGGGSGITITSNVTATGNGTETIASDVTIGSGGKLDTGSHNVTFDGDVTINGGNLISNDGTLNINGSVTVNSGTLRIEEGNINFGNKGSITLKGGKIEIESESEIDGGKLKVEGGKLVVIEDGLEIKNGTELTLTGGTFEINSGSKITGGGHVVLSGNSGLSGDGLNNTNNQKKIIYESADAGRFQNFISTVNNNQYYSLGGRLSEDIDCNGVSNLPIGEANKTYKGTFDGNGKSLTTVVIDIEPNSGCVGLFAELGAGGTVKDLSISGNISGNFYVGMIAGYNAGTITGCSSSGTVSGNSMVGGIAGRNDGGRIDGCSNFAAVTSKGGSFTSITPSERSYVGGITSENLNGTLRNCYNKGYIEASNGNNLANPTLSAGGIVGQLYSNFVENCYNTGKITAPNISNSYSGGIAGRSGGIGDPVNVNACHNHGSIYGKSGAIGGIAGYNYGTISHVVIYENACSDYVGGGNQPSSSTSYSDWNNQQATICQMLQNWVNSANNTAGSTVYWSWKHGASYPVFVSQSP